MDIYYIFMEARPLPGNKESKKSAGAYINCWVKAADEATAKKEAIRHIHDNEGWQVLYTEETFIANREMYLDTPESLKCFDRAAACGIGLFFYIWPKGCEDEFSDPRKLN